MPDFSPGMIAGILRNVEIFKNVPESVLIELGQKVLLIDATNDQTIINQGDRGSSMYVIVSGAVKVHDKEYTIAKLSEGTFFGEFSLLDDEPRSLSVTAIEPSILINIQQTEFFEVLNKHPDVTRDIIKVILKRLRNQNQQIINQLREKQKELEELVRIRTADLRQKNDDLELTLAALKRTQTQLIQQEKLASLGQITAGIAHEIQNPLNFINNFSSISKELAEEILTSATAEEQVEIVSDLRTNLSKIEEHGKRADRIVKGMLMHTKSSKGEKQMTDLKALCEQALHLAFNSFSTNFPDLNCDLEKNFGDVPQILVFPQDLSRVLINVINNAFYAVNQRKSAEGINYRPTVRLDLLQEDGKVVISVYDNGVGIPDSNKDKLFLPFFTTKPTGLHTGLGLSTGYDMLKANGGEISFESKENEFTRFKIFLPTN
jgi:C4-dicarboxylate-specific signal transduction histidine kinase